MFRTHAADVALQAPREGLPCTAAAEPQRRNGGLSGIGSMQTIGLPTLSAYGAVSVAQWPRRQRMSYS